MTKTSIYTYFKFVVKTLFLHKWKDNGEKDIRQSFKLHG